MTFLCHVGIPQYVVNVRYMHQVEHKYVYACGVRYVLLRVKDWGECEGGAVPLARYDEKHYVLYSTCVRVGSEQGDGRAGPYGTFTSYFMLRSCFTCRC